MQAQQYLDEASLDVDSQSECRSLRVVIVYHDVAAGKRAMRVIGDLGNVFGEAVEFRPFPWSFDVLADADWRAVAASDAVNADILILATSDSDPLPIAIERWAETVIDQKRGTHSAVVALFGTEEDPDGRPAWRFEAIEEAAQRAGLDFFAAAVQFDLPDEAVTCIHHNAETIKPRADETICPQHFAARWGINE